MKIALDYDDTFTKDRAMWQAFVALALSSGHEVKFVTFRQHDYAPWSRGQNEDIFKDAAILGIDVIFTHGQQKARCYDAHVWIDDSPELIPKYDLALIATLIEDEDNEQTFVSEAGAAGSNQGNQGAGGS